MVNFNWASSMPLPFGLSKRRVLAGPYLKKPNAVFGVKMAAEIEAASNVWIPVRDFGVPRKDQEREIVYSLSMVIERIAKAQPVYVGCRGGLGRTGIYLGLMAKALGAYDPVGYVRQYYDVRAIETEEQEDYVYSFPVRGLKFSVWKSKGTAALVDFADAVGLPRGRLGV